MHLPTDLDLTFHALSDGTRRAMIGALDQGRECNAGELGRMFKSAQPTISKHLKVLEQAGLVERRIVGRSHRFRLRPEPLDEVERWIERHRAFWKGAIGQLETLLAEAPHDPS